MQKKQTERLFCYGSLSRAGFEINSKKLASKKIIPNQAIRFVKNSQFCTQNTKTCLFRSSSRGKPAFSRRIFTWRCSLVEKRRKLLACPFKIHRRRGKQRAKSTSNPPTQYNFKVITNNDQHILQGGPPLWLVSYLLSFLCMSVCGVRLINNLYHR